MKIEIEKRIDDYTREVFTFWYWDRDNSLILDDYSLETRKTIRSTKWHRSIGYSRLKHRDSRMSEADVPLTDGIRQEAMQKFLRTFSVKLWSEIRRQKRGND